MGIIEELANLRGMVDNLAAAVGRHSRVPEQRWGVVTACTASEIRVTFPGETGDCIVTRSTEAVWVGAQVLVQVQGSDRWITGLSGATIPAGSITFYAGATPPPGWLSAAGGSYSRSTYWRLFAAIGTTFGSVDGSTFTVPDLRDRTLMGSSASRPLGQTGGSASATVADHQHDVRIALMDANHMPTGVNAAMGAPGANYGGVYNWTTGTWSGAAGDGDAATATRNPGGTAASARIDRMVSTGNTKPGGAHTIDLTPPYLAVGGIIKF